MADQGHTREDPEQSATHGRKPPRNEYQRRPSSHGPKLTYSPHTLRRMHFLAVFFAAVVITILSFVAIFANTADVEPIQE